MRKRVKLYLLCVAVLTSCSQEFLPLGVEAFSSSVEKASQGKSEDECFGTSNFTGVTTSTYQDVVQYLKFGSQGRQTRSTQEIDSMLEPYVMDGDTIAWIVNQEEGWELLSNDRRSPLVLARSEKGHFSMDSENTLVTDYITEILNQQSFLKKREFLDSDTIHGDWSFYYLPAESVLPEQIIHKDISTRLSQNPDDDEEHYGYWLLLSQTEIGEHIYEHPHAITTHWNQNMNTYIPNNLLAGCGSISAAQYLYYLYTQYHRPATIVDTATLNAAGDHYIFSGNSALIWNNISNSSYRDLFIGYVAESIGTQFDSNISIADPYSLCPFINSFGYSLSEYSYTASNISSGISSKGAILCNAGSFVGSGHSFIIDYLRTESRITRCVYGWVETDRNGNPIYNLNPPYDESMFEYTTVQNRSTQSSFMRMNWGTNPDDDDLDFSLAAIPLAGFDQYFYIYY